MRGERTIAHHYVCTLPIYALVPSPFSLYLFHNAANKRELRTGRDEKIEGGSRRRKRRSEGEESKEGAST